MKVTSILAATLLATFTSASPIPSPSDASVARRADQGATDILLKIAPTSGSCSGAPFPEECATASDAAQPLIDSFSKYQIATPGEQAALLSLMAFESGDFKYNKNHYPGRPGQGCRNMMMPNFVSEYAATMSLSNSDPAALLQQVIQAGGEWGAAAWFYSTKCGADVKTGLQAGTKAGWESFITGCVQTTLTDDRTSGWMKAAQALGLSGN